MVSCLQKFRKFYPLLFSLIFIGLLATIVSIIKEAGYHITYSVTPSMPQGFYLIVPIKKIARYDAVEFMPPKAALDFARDLHWVPENGFIIKYVFAIPGDDVCVRDEAIWINGKKIGKVYRFYAFGKLLPQTKICGKLVSDQYLLMSTKRQRSFDGRYFGPVTSLGILGRAIPIFITKL